MMCKNCAYHIEFIILTSMHRVMHRVDNGPRTPGGPDHRNAAPRVRPQAPRYCFGSFPAPDPRRIPPRFRRLKECTRRYIKHAANIPSIPDGTHGGFPIAFPSVVSTASLSLDGRGRFDDAGFSLADINIPIPGPHREGRKRPSDMVRVKEAAGLQQAINKPSPCRHYSGCRWAASG